MKKCFLEVEVTAVFCKEAASPTQGSSLGGGLQLKEERGRLWSTMAADGSPEL